MRIEPSRSLLGISPLVAIRGIILVQAVALCLAHRYTMNADALSYLEVGEAWVRGDFSNAINGYWSPLYPILIALASKLSTARMNELVAPHLLQVVFLILAYVAFRWFLKPIERIAVLDRPETQEKRFWFLLIAEALFFWSTLKLIEIFELGPDLLMMIWVLLASGILLRAENLGPGAGIKLGLFLGLGYLTKPVMFPLGLVFLVGAAFFLRPFRAGMVTAATATAAFLTISALYIVPLSLQKQRFTFGDGGSLAYAWEVNDLSPYFHWQGQPPESGIAKNPTRRILDFPPTYEFDRGRPGTYPLWYDASYWNEGLRARFNPRDQIRTLLESAAVYAKLFLKPATLLLFACLLGAVRIVGWRKFSLALAPFAVVIVPSLAALGMYALVLVLSRYIAIFLLLPMIALLAALAKSWPSIEKRDRAVMAAVVSVILLYTSSSGAKAVLLGIRGTKSTSYVLHAKVADQLRTLGVNEGDKIGVVGAGLRVFAARLMNLRIVAEALILEGHPAWPPTAENLERIAEAMARETQVTAIISDAAPENAPPPWKKVQGTHYWVLPLERR